MGQVDGVATLEKNHSVRLGFFCELLYISVEISPERGNMTKVRKKFNQTFLISLILYFGKTKAEVGGLVFSLHKFLFESDGAKNVE